MRLSTKFRCTKNPRSPPLDRKPAVSHQRPGCSEPKRAPTWSVYLIRSTRLQRTYVGATTDFSRRLKQHNGELKGGAKASSAGRPWVLACLVQGFKNQSEACEFESKWKNISRKLPREKKTEDDASNSLLQHRRKALKRVETLFDCSCLQIQWIPCAS